MIKLDIQKFAGSTFEFGASGYLQGRIIWSSSSNGSAANSSNVTATLQVHRTNNATTTGTWSGSLNINGDNRAWSWYGSISNGWVSVFSFTITVGHNNDGSRSIYIGGSVKGPSGTSLANNTSSGGQNVTLDKIARFATMNSANNFNDEENPSFTYSNPAGLNNLNCWLEINPAGEHLATRNISSTATSGTYTWELTQEEKEQLRAKIPNDTEATCRIGLYSTISGSTQASFKDVKYTIINGNPVFNNFTFEDINPITLALTGDSSININGYSNIRAKISTLNKAEAIKGATMSKYRFSILNNDSVEANYSDDEEVLMTINNADNGTYNIYAIDSRNNSTLVTKLSSQDIPYTPLVRDIDFSATRDAGGVGGNVNISFSGSIWNHNFGQIQNAFTSAKYRLKKTNSSEWIDLEDLGITPTNITPTITDDTFTFNGLIRSNNPDTTWDLESSYDIEITLKDKLSTISFIITLASAIPNLSLALDGVGIMCDYDEEVGGLLQIGGKQYLDYEVIDEWED